MLFAHLRICSIIAILIGLLLVTPVPASAADGATPVNRAGLVVQHGDGSLTYAVVAFSEPSISGMDLLGRSGLDYLSVPFGGLGEGVCQIEREGCDVATCRRTVCQTTRSLPYWQYLQQGSSGWHAAALGASGSKVTDGAVLAWAWAAGSPSLPALDLAGVASRAGIDPDALTVLGQPGQDVALVRTGYGGPEPARDTTSLLGGLAATLGVAVAAVGLLLVRRRRVARL